MVLQDKLSLERKPQENVGKILTRRSLNGGLSTCRISPPKLLVCQLPPISRCPRTLNTAVPTVETFYPARGGPEGTSWDGSQRALRAGFATTRKNKKKESRKKNKGKKKKKNKNEQKKRGKVKISK